MNGYLLPNFYILGAAKAGTTSLYHALRKHPQVYLSPVKEPHFFDIEANFVKGLEYYQNTFFRNSDRYLARGEATPAYFHLVDIVAPRLLQVYQNSDEQPKFIVSLRDPVERAWSHYMHRVRVAMETETLENAIDLEEERLLKRPSEWVGYYRDGLYGTILRKWFDLFGRERFLVFLMQDFIDDPLGVGKDLATFLGVKDDITFDFSRKENVTAKPRSEWFMNFLTHPSMLKEPLKIILPKLTRRRIKEFLYRKNLRAYESRPMMDAKFEFDLRQRYTADIMDLQNLLTRDLSSWLPASHEDAE